MSDLCLGFKEACAIASAYVPHKSSVAALGSAERAPKHLGEAGSGAEGTLLVGLDSTHVLHLKPALDPTLRAFGILASSDPGDVFIVTAPKTGSLAKCIQWRRVHSLIKLLMFCYNVDMTYAVTYIHFVLVFTHSGLGA